MCCHLFRDWFGESQIAGQKFSVGGIELDRPFQIRRLGHFQFMSHNVASALRFYQDLLGFRVADTLDFGSRLPEVWRTPDRLAEIGDTKVYFHRCGNDHHSFIIGSAKVRRILRNDKPRITVSQITWQVGSFREVVTGNAWFEKQGMEIFRIGRDKPGSNWHSYIWDPDGHTNEIYYGIDQIGWDGASKPFAMYKNANDYPPLPHIADLNEVRAAEETGVDPGLGHHTAADDVTPYDVGGVSLSRPFKIVGIGPVRLFTLDMSAALAFYAGVLGLRVTEEVVWKGHRCYFLRSNTEHHSLALYPDAIRADLGISDRSLNLSFGVRVNDYDQLRDGLKFLAAKGIEIRRLPHELSPGIAYSAFAVDPDGHLIQLYHQMEQIGWDGKPRPASQRHAVDDDAWPATIEALPDSLCGEQFSGPWF